MIRTGHITLFINAEKKNIYVPIKYHQKA